MLAIFYIDANDPLVIFIKLHTSLTPFARSPKTLRDHLTGPMHS